MNVSWGSVQLIIYIRNGKLYNLFFNSKMSSVKGISNRWFVVFVCWCKKRKESLSEYVCRKFVKTKLNGH